VPEHEVAFQILALNTEKAHNLKEKSLEVIRMYRGLVGDEPSSGEEDYAFQFESAHFITLGLLYEKNKRFAGGAFAPILRRVDKFLKGRFPKTLEEREERAELVRAADEALVDVVAKIKKRGINHPYVKNFVLARTTPLTRERKTLPSFDQTFKRLVANIESFDVAKVRYEDIQGSAIRGAPGAGGERGAWPPRPGCPTPTSQPASRRCRAGASRAANSTRRLRSRTSSRRGAS